MQLQQSVVNVLEKRSTFYLLLSLSGLVLVTLFVLNLHTISGDQHTYMNYVKGIQQGRYTYWYFLDEYIPDTFRNPGYPLFLYLLSVINESILFVKFVQLLLMICSIYLMLKIIESYSDSLVLKNLFLFLLSFNFVILYYPALIYPEVLMLFLVTLILYIEITLKENSWKKTILLALLYGFCFQVRPVIIFIPFIRTFYFLFRQKELSLQKNATFIILFILTLLPYGFWNLKHHQVFKITPLEGGGGAMYLGYWSPKMVNHVVDRYWKNTTYKDLMINFANEEETQENVKLFNREWDSIESVCSSYLSEKDTILIDKMKEYPGLFITHNTEYTLAREKILKELAVKHYLNDIAYSMKLKVYTFFRLWYTGLSLNKYSLQNNVELTKMTISFVTTFTTLLLFVFYFVYCLFKRREILNKIIVPLLLCLYFTIFHLPFVIQSRYTTPVKLLFLFSICYMIYQIHFTNKKEYELQ